MTQVLIQTMVHVAMSLVAQIQTLLIIMQMHVLMMILVVMFQVVQIQPLI